ncbi:MAG: hypothetical protein HY706_07810 [Candidatus Hydrogenedentes bacterium]|nr:hypothetical protein [Candidatus Hydrogenedentota bacterium]
MTRARPQRVRISGWAKWLPVLLLPFSVLFLETWLTTQSLEADYEVGRLNKRVRELREELDALRAEIAKLEAMDRVHAKAPDLGLVEPEPNQIEIIYAPPDSTAPSREPHYTVAQLPLTNGGGDP